MAYEIRAEDEVFNVYEDGEYMGILSCPFEQTAEAFVEEMNGLGYTVIRRHEIANIGDFDVEELNAWDVFAIDPDDEAFDADDEEAEQA